MSGHGYGPYTNGCRCGVCRAAKADYMRAHRARGRAYAQRLTSPAPGQQPRRNVFAPGAERAHVDGIKHGRHGYEVKGCRCEVCTAARTASDRRRNARRRERAAP